jgi:uridine kinase
MDQLLKDLLNWITETDKRIVIGISGHGAAGKTTFANKLVHLLPKDEVNYINTDPYIVSSTIRKSAMIDYTYENNTHRYKMTACHPAAHHLPSLERDVKMIKDGLELYTIDTHYRNSELISATNKVTIVEGMSVAFLKPELFDLTIYFYTDEETEFQRRSIRDIAERGIDIDYLRQSHEERRIQYEVFMHPYSKNFEIIIKSSDTRVCVEKNVFECKST